MASARQVVEGFKLVANDPTFRSRWYSDDGIVSLLRHRYHYSGVLEVNYNKLNSSLARDSVFKHSYNDIHTDGKIRYQQVRKQIVDLSGKKRSATFYYIGYSSAEISVFGRFMTLRRILY